MKFIHLQITASELEVVDFWTELDGAPNLRWHSVV